MNLLMFSSCLNSTDEGELDYSPDAQIYSFSMASRADTTNVLSTTVFTIDQVNGKIFNKKPLPYKFHVDSVVLNIRGASTFSPFTNVSIELLPEYTISWSQSDSINVSRLNRITTTAPDGKNKKTYQFQLNIYQQDPYILSWKKVSESYFPQEVSQQKTVAFNDFFITYYIANETINAKASPIGDAKSWTSATLSGLPHTTQLSTMTVAENDIFVIEEDSTLFKSSDGVSWTQVTTEFPIVAIYGVFPSATKGDILAIINDNGILKLAETDDFTNLQIMELSSGVNLSDLPVKDFTATQIESTTSFGIRYIAIAGGIRADNSYNSDIWILQEKDSKIFELNSKKPGTISLDGSSIFFYDEKPYLLLASSENNILLYSGNNGTEWKTTEENQALPSDFDYRKNATVITENDNIWIFGGVSKAQVQITDVWKGRLNKFDLN